MALASSNGFLSSNHGQPSSAPSGSNGGEKERLSLKLEVGHESEMLNVGPNPPYGTHTHRWTIFVRGPNETPLDSSLIQKVVFQLHEDFPNPRRCVSSPPFEVTETGYAGFIIPLYIHFVGGRKEYYLEYDMNLRYDPVCKTKVVKTLEFKEPKSELRAKLLKAGAEIVSGKHAKQTTLPQSESFASVFGETICLKPQNDCNYSTGKVKNNVVMKAPSKPAPSSSSDATKVLAKSASIPAKAKPPTVAESENKPKPIPASSSKKSKAEQPIASSSAHVARSSVTIKAEKDHNKNNGSASVSIDHKIFDSPMNLMASTSSFIQNVPGDAIKKEKEDKEKKKKHKKHRDKIESVPISNSVKLETSDEIPLTNVRPIVNPKKEPPAPQYSPLFCVASPSYSPSTSAKDSTADQIDNFHNSSSLKSDVNSIKQSPPVLKPIAATQKSSSKKRKKLDPPRLSAVGDIDHPAPTPPRALAPPQASSSTADTVGQSLAATTIDSFSSPHVKLKKRPKNRSDSGLDSDYSANSVECRKNNLSPSVAVILEQRSPCLSTSNGDHADTKFSTPSASTSKVKDKAANIAKTVDADAHPSAPAAPPPDERHVRKLLNLQRKIMTLDDADAVQRVVDVLSAGIADFWVTDDGNFEFDLFSLDCHVVERLTAIFTNINGQAM